RESSATAAARQIGHALTSSVEYGFIDSVDASIYASKSKAMTSVGEAWTQSESGSKAMEAQFKHRRGMFRELIRTRDAGPKDGPADAGSSC
nr:hypothetical protein [Tanacetum cinerariifolium]